MLEKIHYERYNFIQDHKKYPQYIHMHPDDKFVKELFKANRYGFNENPEESVQYMGMKLLSSNEVEIGKWFMS